MRTVSVNRRTLLQGGLALAGVGLLSGCGAVELPWRRTTKVPRIGFLSAGSQTTHPVASLDAFRAALGDLGYVEGDTITIDYRWADGRFELLRDRADELVKQDVDVIVAYGTPGVQAAQRVTSTIPIVMAYAGDPVGQGFVASLARPGGNVTGLTTLSPELAPKRLQLLKECFPPISRIGVLYQPEDPGRALAFRETEAAAHVLGMQILALEVRNNEVSVPLATAIGERAAALVVLAGDAALADQRRTIVDCAAQHRLPTMNEAREWVDAGGLMGYGVSFPDLFGRAASYVHKILRGARPGELPVERPTKFDFVINLKTAQAIGLTIPQTVLQQATEIIQ